MFQNFLHKSVNCQWNTTYIFNHSYMFWLLQTSQAAQKDKGSVYDTLHKNKV